MGKALTSLRDFWFGEMDAAPVAAFRVVFGLLLFNWFWQLAQDARFFFADEGIMPRLSAALLRWYGDRFSVLNLSGELWLFTAVWLLALLVSVLVAVGYRTRIATALAFLLVISFEQRMPLMLDGSDFVMRATAFWLIFAPAGERYSLDAALRRARGEHITGKGWAFPVRLLWLQLAWIYLATAFEKIGGPTWFDGTAVYYALQVQYTFARPWAEPLSRLEPFVRLTSWGTIAIEWVFLPAVFFPVWQPAVRLIAVAGAALLHLGILTLMNVGNFPITMLAALIPFLPAPLVERAVGAGGVLSRPSRLRLFYDGDRDFCRRTAAFLRALDLFGTATYSDFREGGFAAAGLSLRQLERRIHLIDEHGRVFAAFAALARLGRGIPLLLPIWVLGLNRATSALAERGYDWIAARRPLLAGHRGEPRVPHRERPDRADPLVPPPPPPWLRLPGTVALVLVALVALGTGAPAPLNVRAMTTPIAGFIRYFSLDQRWDVFAPDPSNMDRWLRVVGRLADGTTVELIDEHGRPRPLEPLPYSGTSNRSPRRPDPLYSRWTRVNERIAYFPDFRSDYASMFCRLRNITGRRPGAPLLAAFDVFFTERYIPTPGSGSPYEFKEYHLWTHRCF